MKKKEVKKLIDKEIKKLIEQSVQQNPEEGAIASKPRAKGKHSDDSYILAQPHPMFDGRAGA